MEKPVFNPASFVDIDLATGEISSTVKERLALVPTRILKTLQPGDALTNAAEAWGSQHGRILAEHLEQDPDLIGIEELSSFLSGTAAALGMGRLSIELRQGALMFRARGVGSEDEELSDGESALLTGFLSGYLSALGQQPFGVLHMGEEHGDHLFFAGNPVVVEEVQNLPVQGQARLAAIEKLIAGSQ